MQDVTQKLDQEPQTVDVNLSQDFDKFEEYKLFIEDTARFSDRRQSVTNNYIAINGAILALISFLFKDAGFNSIRNGDIFAILPALFAGAIVCYFWLRLLQSYKRLIGFRFAELEKMEAQIPGAYRMYAKESDTLYKRAPKKQQISQSKIEMRLPWLFGVLYLIIFVAVIVTPLFVH